MHSVPKLCNLTPVTCRDPRPFSYPKDASDFRKQFCVGEFSAKKKDGVRLSPTEIAGSPSEKASRNTLRASLLRALSSLRRKQTN